MEHLYVRRSSHESMDNAQSQNTKVSRLSPHINHHSTVLSCVPKSQRSALASTIYGRDERFYCPSHHPFLASAAPCTDCKSGDAQS